MADLPLRPALALLALFASGCNVRRDSAGPRSITVPLPPARPAAAAAGFSFQNPQPEPIKRVDP